MQCKYLLMIEHMDDEGGNMKRFILVMMSLLMLLTAGCGSEVTFVVPIPFLAAPSITYYQYSQDSADLFVDGTVEFSAPGFDLNTITVSTVDSRGMVTEQTVTSLGAFNGISYGTIPFSIDYISYRPDTYTFTIYLTDKAGYISNPVYGSFRV